MKQININLNKVFLNTNYFQTILLIQIFNGVNIIYNLEL